MWALYHWTTSASAWHLFLNLTWTHIYQNHSWNLTRVNPSFLWEPMASKFYDAENTYIKTTSLNQRWIPVQLDVDLNWSLMIINLWNLSLFMWYVWQENNNSIAVKPRPMYHCLLQVCTKLVCPLGIHVRKNIKIPVKHIWSLFIECD